jgi:hypothetical protein
VLKNLDLCWWLLAGMIYAISGVRVNKTTNRGQANMHQNLSPLTLWYGVVLAFEQIPAKDYHTNTRSADP